MDEFKNIRYKINIKDIKSSYITKKLFSFLSRKQKLDIIMYNKNLQKILSIGIKDYKKIYGKYIIGEKNGKGKEFLSNTDKLIFEGEYLNWKKNGKGKEYYKNYNLKFEGEYLNGQKMEKEKNII